MENNSLYQYIKLILDYFPFWALSTVCIVIYTIRKPDWIGKVSHHIEIFKVGPFELSLRRIEKKLKETEEHLDEVEQENIRLNEYLEKFNTEIPGRSIENKRQAIKALSGSVEDLSPVVKALKSGADPDEVYAAAEILRSRRNLSAFDELIDAIDRIASDNKLEGLRYRTVWTLSSAAHRTVLAAVKHSDQPKLSKQQLERAREALLKLMKNPHVQKDRPDDPKKGIIGPSTFALNWIEKGLKKHEELEIVQD